MLKTFMKEEKKLLKGLKTKYMIKSMNNKSKLKEKLKKKEEEGKRKKKDKKKKTR